MKPEYKKYLIIGGVVVLLVVGYWLFARNTIVKKQTADETPTEQVLPTVDSSVKVSLKAVSANKEVSLEVSGMPAGTQSVDYELSYQTAAQGLQGVIGTVSSDGQTSFKKQLTLGTCSSGTCVYHQVVGKINLTLKFTGDYGEKLFEKEFAL